MSKRRRHAVTRWMLLLGLVAQVASGVLAQLGSMGIGAGSVWYPVTVASLGGALQVLGFLGWSRARAEVEAAQLLGVAPAQVKP